MRRFLTLIGVSLGVLAAVAPGALGEKVQRWAMLLAETAESAVNSVGVAASNIDLLADPWKVAGPLILAMAPGLVALLVAAVSQSALWLTRVLAGILAVLALVALFSLELSQAVVVAIPCALIAGVALVAGGAVVTLGASALSACLAVSYTRWVLSPEFTEPLSGDFSAVVSSLAEVDMPTHLILAAFAVLPIAVTAFVLLRGVVSPRET